MMKPLLHLPGAIIVTLCAATAAAQAATWDAGGGADVSWGNPLNWSDDAAPGGKDLVFKEAGKTNAATVNNRVEGDLTVNSLIYENTGATANDWHVTEIVSGATLTASGAGTPFQVGQLVASGTKMTQVAIQGEGTFKIDQNGGVLALGNTSSGSANNGTLIDLSGLAVWDVELGGGAFGIGNNTRNVTTLLLARSNALEADTIQIGGGTGNNSGGTLRFDTADSGAKSITIRGDAGGAVASFGIGAYTGGATSGKQNGVVDFSGGSVDALVTSLLIGSSQASNAGGQGTGALIMDRGIFEVQNVTAGQSRANANATAVLANTGTIDILGGTFHAGSILLAERLGANQAVTGELTVSGSGIVNVDGGITLGRRATGTTTTAITATVNVEGGGSLTVGGDIARGSGLDAINATLNLNGGLLDLQGNAVDVNTFTVTSGTLRNLGEFNSGAALAKTTAGTLVVEGVNGYTGQTEVQAGTLLLSGSLTASAVRVAENALLGGKGGLIGGGLTMEDGSSFSFTLDSAADYGRLSAASITLEGAVNLNLVLNYAPLGGETFTLLSGGSVLGAIASVNGVALEENAFSLQFGSETYDFLLSYGAGDVISVAVVPEPSSLLLGGAALLGGLCFLRRHKRSA